MLKYYFHFNIGHQISSEPIIERRYPGNAASQLRELTIVNNANNNNNNNQNINHGKDNRRRSLNSNNQHSQPTNNLNNIQESVNTFSINDELSSRTTNLNNLNNQNMQTNQNINLPILANNRRETQLNQLLTNTLMNVTESTNLNNLNSNSNLQSNFGGIMICSRCNCPYNNQREFALHLEFCGVLRNSRLMHNSIFEVLHLVHSLNRQLQVDSAGLSMFGLNQQEEPEESLNFLDWEYYTTATGHVIWKNAGPIHLKSINFYFFKTNY
jgi:hypothetical protein